MAKEPTYFMYFPGNYRWSAAFLNMMSLTPYGASEIGELYKIGRMLKDKAPEDDEAWFDACVKVADGVRAHAERFDKSRPPRLRGARLPPRLQLLPDGRAVPHPEGRGGARHLPHRRRLLPPPCGPERHGDRGRGGPLRRRAPSRLFRAGAECPLEADALRLFFDGLDVTKELQYLRGVPDLVKRGISCLVMDGPGTGEAIRFRGHYLRHDYEVAGSACVDYLEKRADVDPAKIGVVAMSLGGYYAPRCASLEPRFAACIAWGAQWDYYEVWKKRIDASFKTSLSVPGHHIMWIFGVDTLDAALKKLEPFRLDGVVQKMRCPFLVTHGAEDEQIPLAHAQALYDACGSKDKTLRVFTVEEGGAQHCQRDYLTLGIAEMWNWFEDKLVRGR